MAKHLDLFRNSKPDVILGHFKSFHLEYHHNHVAGYAARSLCSGLLNFMEKPVKERWGKRDRNSLWWTVNSSNQFENQCVKRHHIRRTRCAFRDGLKSLGYDEEGNPVMVDGGSKSDLKPIRGSMALQIRKEIMERKYAELKEEVVRGIQEALMAPSTRKSGWGPQRNTKKVAKKSITVPAKSSWQGKDSVSKVRTISLR
ncbi:hypothetical protein EJ08DRAFT_701248 [Tothia fuscella]|uniref:Uncharacterized protein n=1 Tax=Tothia fuscella TaxID=1048955 RepID=A0A9P4TV06_9PEZI|nr:hypothetical protein EJ08DRAFT_701248 [Tothia fuscella]